MLSRICFMLLCAFAVQLHGAEEESASRVTIEHHSHGDHGESYTEWTKWDSIENRFRKIKMCVFSETGHGNYRGWEGSDQHAQVTWLSTEQAHAQALRLEKEYARQGSIRLKKERDEQEAKIKVFEEKRWQARKKSMCIIVGSTVFLYASYALALDCWKKFGASAFRLVTGE